MERNMCTRVARRLCATRVSVATLSCSTCTSAYGGALVTSSRGFVEHSTDPKKWRNPENEDVRRQYRQGVPLNSAHAEVKRRAEIERQLVEEDKYTDWFAWYTTGAVCALFLLFLNVVVEFVEPEPSPEYVPYEKPEKKP